MRLTWPTVMIGGRLRCADCRERVETTYQHEGAWRCNPCIVKRVLRCPEGGLHTFGHWGNLTHSWQECTKCHAITDRRAHRQPFFRAGGSS